jgi:hypothetical protein
MVVTTRSVPHVSSSDHPLPIMTETRLIASNPHSTSRALLSYTAAPKAGM